jgi:hypothetical protein
MISRSMGVHASSRMLGALNQKRTLVGVISQSNFTGTLGTSGSCIRAETCYYLDSNNSPASAAANIERYSVFNNYAGLLLEPLATNVLNNSTKPETSGWAKARTNILSGAIAGPFPGTISSKVQESSGASGTHTITQTSVLSNSTRYWASAYVQPSERTWIYFFHNDKAGTSHGGWVSLSGAGALGTTVGTPIGRKVELISGGWYRISFGFDSITGSGTTTCSLNLSTGNNIQVYTPDASNTFGLYVWGVQVEQSSGGPSTPIVTTATSGIRSQDQIKYNYAVPASGYETLKLVTPWVGTDGVSHILFDSGKTLVSERIYLEKSADSLLRLRVYGATSGAFSEVYGTVNSTSWSSGAIHTLEARWDPVFGLSLTLDGVSISGTNSSGSFSFPSGFGTSYYLGGDLNGGSSLNGIIYGHRLLSKSSLISPAAITRTLYSREGSNGLSNSDVSGSTNWSLVSGAVFTSGVTRSGSTGSFDISQVNPLARIEAGSSNFFNVSSGEVITYGYYMKSSDPTIVVSDFVGMYTSGSVFIANSPQGHRQTAASTDWVECVSILPVPSGVGKLKIVAGRLDSNTSGGTVYIDDFFIFRGRGFEQNRTTRSTFNGGRVRIDSLGNMDVLQGSNWIPFFPFGIAQDQTLSSYTRYASAGFNTIMFGFVDAAQINKAKATVDATYAPSGMYAFQEVYEYLGNGGARYANLIGSSGSLSGVVASALASSGADHFLGYYFDNEAYTDYDIPVSGIGIIRQQDNDRPIFMNSGNPVLSRMYRDNINWVGSYNSNDYDYNFILDNIEGIKAPLGLACISLITSGGLFRRDVYRAIIQGNKGIFYWKDGGAEGDITTRSWWAEAPVVRSEVDTLLPIIRQPHWTTWTKSVSGGSYLIRSSDYNTKGYVFLLNLSPVSGAAVVTVSGLTYTPSGTTDALTGSGAVSVTSGVFTVPLSGYGTKVLRLD